MPRSARRAAVLAALLAAASCRSRGDGDARERAFASKQQEGPAPFDFDRPVEALRMTAADASAREGSFAWEAQVDWTVAKPGAPDVRAVERHRVRQLATGEFTADAQVDPGGGPGSVTGREVVFAGGMTYARGRWAPFRERPAAGRDGAGRFRDESFQVAGAVADLVGPGLRADAVGQATVLGRPARRYALSLASGAAPRASRPPAGLPDGGYDADTKRHLAFADGRAPTAARGELVLDARTGVPLAVDLEASFTERGDPQLRADVKVAARMSALGGAVAAVEAPKNALPDERKPKGVARALEAAGLKKRAAGAAADESEDEPEEPAGQ
jgi:hypothetical protein